ncbi:Rhomboid-like protein 15 [Dionaea muscipula]
MAGLPTRFHQWWEGIPLVTSSVLIGCSTIYLVCLLAGYDSFVEICFLPSAIMSKFQVYRIFTSILFHSSLLHVMFNMLALVPLGSDLERIMGSIRMLHMIILLATSSALFHILIALAVAYNPFHHYANFMNECSIGFSGVLFSMIVIETSLSGVQSRSVFGLFEVPAKWYAWILLVVFQLLMSNVSLLGHLCGILSGFAYTFGLLNYLVPGALFFSSIESSSWLSVLVRRPKFIISTGVNPSGNIPTYSSQNTTTHGLLSGNIWSRLSSWMPQRDTTSQSTQDSRFPGQGRTLAGFRTDVIPARNSDSNLHASLLVNTSTDHPSDVSAINPGNRRQSSMTASVEATGIPTTQQDSVGFDEEVQKLVSMGFERTQVEVALAAADGDLEIAVEILMTQQA